jgi:hypothetical protein
MNMTGAALCGVNSKSTRDEEADPCGMTNKKGQGNSKSEIQGSFTSFRVTTKTGWM